MNATIDLRARPERKQEGPNCQIVNWVVWNGRTVRANGVFFLTPLRYRLRSKGHPQAPPWQKSWYFHQLIDCIYVFSFDLLLSWEHTCGVALVDVSFLFMMKILHSMFVVLCLTQISSGSLSQWIFNFSPDWCGVLTVLPVYEEPSSPLTEIVCELAATPKWTATSGGNK